MLILLETIRESRIKSLERKKMDTIFTTNDPVVLKGIEIQPAIVSLQKSATKLLCSEEDFICSNKMSFGSEIGAITNRSTSMFDVLAKFEPGSREYEALMYRIICSIQYQQNSIKASVESKLSELVNTRCDNVVIANGSESVMIYE